MKLMLLTPVQMSVQKIIAGAADLQWKLVRRVGVLHEHRIGPAENTGKDGERGAHTVVDACRFEVGVSNGRIDEHRAGSYGG